PPDAAALPEQGDVKETFHSIGLYWTPPSTPGQGLVKIRYAKRTDTTWKEGHDLWYDNRTIASRSPEARGSIVMLEPGTPYVVKFGTLIDSSGSSTDESNIRWVAKKFATTWSESFPIGSRADNKTWSGTKTTFTNSVFP